MPRLRSSIAARAARNFALTIAATAGLVALPACGAIEEAGRAKIAGRFAEGEAILSDPVANFYGLTSRGHGQIRGNGALVLTADQIWFSQLSPATELTIPRADVLEVSLVKSHLGKATAGHSLLHVRFRSGDGEDSAAWLVAEPERWLRALADPAAAAASGRDGARDPG